MIYNLKNYQIKAVNEIKEEIISLLKRDKKGRSFIFKAPTGSGKTFIASSIIEQLTEETDKDICILWGSIGLGDLISQSRDAVNEYMGGDPICTLIDTDFNEKRKNIDKNEVVFFNWEKLVNKHKNTGQWKNELMKDREGKNFIDLINNTKKINRKIILIVDESHRGSKSDLTRIAEFRSEVLDPFFTLEMSATPNGSPDFEVDIDDVISEGMIKKNIITNKEFDEKLAEENEGKTSEKIILEQGLNKKIELNNEYNKIGSKVNPLLLIQIPNKEKGQEKIDFIKEFLRDKSITEQNGRLKIWTNDFPLSIADKKNIKKIDSKVDCLIFKTAIATGWDCPRAQILIKFREVESENFEIQTIGRILRTPERKSYDNNILDSAYIFTNVSSFDTSNTDFKPNRIKTEVSNFRTDNKKNSIYTPIKLESYYRSREGNYNSADSDFYEFLEKEFLLYFNITDEDILVDSHLKKIESKGVSIDLNINLNILKETNLDVKKIDKEQTVTAENIQLMSSETDIRNSFYNSIKNHLSGLAFIRSKSIITNAFVSTFRKHGLVNNNFFTNTQRLYLQNEVIFSNILENATKKFRIHLSKNIQNKGIFYEFEIEATKSYSRDTFKLFQSNLSLYQPLYVRYRDENGIEQDNILEAQFMLLLDNHKNEIDWFWQNGAEPNKVNFGIPYNNGMDTFRPDFIVKFKNNTIGIYDTKPIDERVEDTKLKAEALYNYIKEQNIKRKKENLCMLKGGIVVATSYDQTTRKYSGFRIYNQPIYKDYKDNNTNWEDITTIFNK